MKERAYTLTEIDRMRAAIVKRDMRRRSRFYRLDMPKHADVEDYLRTYLGAGVAPDELERAAKDEPYEEHCLTTPDHENLFIW